MTFFSDNLEETTDGKYELFSTDMLSESNIESTIEVEDCVIRDIPLAMRRMEWSIAPLLMEKWFNGKKYTLVIRNQNESILECLYKSNPERYDIDTVKMEWALKFPYISSVYDDIYIIAFNKSSIDRLTKLIKNKFNGKIDTQYIFGKNINNGLFAYDCCVNFRTIEVSGEFNDFYGALADCTLKFTLRGSVQKINNDYYFFATHVGAYIRDTYDFNDFQFLGYWDKIRCLSIQETKSEIAGRIATAGIHSLCSRYSSVYNADFRSYREKYGMGGDFFIFSDIKWIECNKKIFLNL